MRILFRPNFSVTTSCFIRFCDMVSHQQKRACVRVWVCVPAVTQLLSRTRPGCWQLSWQPHQASSLLKFLTHLLGMLEQLETELFFPLGFFPVEAIDLSGSYRVLAFNSICVKLNFTRTRFLRQLRGLLLVFQFAVGIWFLKQSNIVLHVSSWFQSQ